jgi:eukaryotic-like serine/threonine-protein kinase
MSTNAVTTFLAQLWQAQILDEGQLAEVERLGQTAARPAEVAAALIQRGWLTPHQANQVARGRGAELLLGSYLVLEPLGRGGMGQVVKARHRYMNRQVALKLVRHDRRDSADTMQRFQREVRLLAELRHPHIVQAYDAGNVGDTWFLAMELLDGVDLERLVRQRGPLPVGQACDFIRQAALGLQHAHERGLVHRDLKPSNLFLTGEGVKLLDLGLARAQAVSDEKQPGDLTCANTVMGTPDYLAPEQALDPRRADARSDLYSLGCTLHALLTGRPPFPEGTLAQKLLAHQTAEPPAVEALRREVPPALAGLLRRLLAKSPAQRPASAAEVAAELAPLAADGGAAAAGLSPGNGSTGLPRGGSTLPSGSVPPASLALARADAPERGWTLATDSLPPAAPSSLVAKAAEGPEHGFTLMAESLPPTPVSAPGPATAAVAPGPQTVNARGLPTPSPGGAPAQAPRARFPLVLAAAAGACLLLVLLVLGALRMFGGAGEPPPGGQTASTDSGQRPKGTEGEKPKKPEAEKPKKEELVKKAAPPSALFPSGPRRFLSELEPFDVTPGEWPIKTGDTGNGQPIKVGGVLSPHGLGMHPPANLGGPPSGAPKCASVKYRLGKEAELFKATVAIDDTTKWCWSPATFTVLGDGKELWQSRFISHTHARSQDCQVIVKGVDVLELRVHVANGNQGVHAVWVEPRVLQKFDSPDPTGGPKVTEKSREPKGKEPLPVVAKNPKETEGLFVMATIAPDAKLAKLRPGDKVFLSDLNEFAFKTTPLNWKFAKEGRVGDPRAPDSMIRVNGTTYPKGLGMHPPNTDYIRVCYALGKRAKSLHGSVALDDGDDPPWGIKTTTFVVIGDGKVLWRSQGIKDRGVIEPFKVDVRGVAVLELRVYTDYNGANGSRAVWLDPYVLRDE